MPSKREVSQFIMKGFIQSIYASTSSLSLNLTEKENILPTNPFQNITSSVNNTEFFCNTFRGCISSGPSSRHTQNSVQFLAPYNAFYSFQDLVFLVQPWLAWFNHNICICLFIWHQINGSNPLQSNNIQFPYTEQHILHVKYKIIL